MLARAAVFFYGASLVTLPWVGAGVLRLATGRDWGGGLQPSWLLLALAMVCTFSDRAGRGCLGRDIQSFRDSGARRWWLIGGTAVLLSVLLSVVGLWTAPVAEPFATTFGRFAKQLVQLAIMACFAAWPALWTRGAGRWSWTVKMLLAGGIFQIVYGALQGMDYYLPLPGFAWLDGMFTSNPSILSGSGELYLGDAFRSVPRLRGTVCEPLYLGNYLLMLIPFGLWQAGAARGRRRLGLVLGLLLLLLATWSRGAWLGLGFQGVLAVFLLAGGPGLGRLDAVTKRRLLWGAGGVLAVFLVLPLIGTLTRWEGLLFPYRRLLQTFSGQDWSNLTRLYSMQAAWRAWLLSPVVGIGWGQFAWHFPLLVDPLGLQSQFTWPVVNNFPLLVLCETGLVGLLVFGSWAFGLTRSFLRGWRIPNPEVATGTPLGKGKGLLLASFLAAAGVGFQMLTFSQYNLPHIWVALGLLLAALNDRSATNREDPAHG